MRVVCTNCKEIHEITAISQAVCPNADCGKLLSPFERDVLQVRLSKEMLREDDKESEGTGL